jgi:hypothetical protein
LNQLHLSQLDFEALALLRVRDQHQGFELFAGLFVFDILIQFLNAFLACISLRLLLGIRNLLKKLVHF